MGNGTRKFIRDDCSTHSVGEGFADEAAEVTLEKMERVCEQVERDRLHFMKNAFSGMEVRIDPKLERGYYIAMSQAMYDELVAAEKKERT